MDAARLTPFHTKSQLDMFYMMPVLSDLDTILVDTAVVAIRLGSMNQVDMEY